MKITHLLILAILISVVVLGCAGAPDPQPQEEQPSPAPSQTEAQQPQPAEEPAEEPAPAPSTQQRTEAEQLKEEAVAERGRALSVKADVAQRSLFNDAQEHLSRGEELFSSEEYGDALSAFTAARSGFRDAYVAARDQRERALRALETLDSDLIETARELERMQQDVEGEDDET